MPFNDIRAAYHDGVMKRPIGMERVEPKEKEETGNVHDLTCMTGHAVRGCRLGPRPNFRRVEHTEDRKRSLSMKWVVVTDALGNGRLRMRWTVARFLPSGHGL
jgi:hypothetical protein